MAADTLREVGVALSCRHSTKPFPLHAINRRLVAMRHFWIIAFIFLFACRSKTYPEQQPLADSSSKVKQAQNIDTARNIWIDKLNGQHYPLPDSIGGKPVSFYLNNPKVAALAKAFYRGQFRPVDNDSTTQLLSYVTTHDSLIRPFYRWCLDFTIQISDGALAEYPGEPALRYATKFPKEFFAYMDKDELGQRYKQWTENAAYSISDNNGEDSNNIQKNVKSAMLANCSSYDIITHKRIDKFAKDITNAIKLNGRL